MHSILFLYKSLLEIKKILCKKFLTHTTVKKYLLQCKLSIVKNVISH